MTDQEETLKEQLLEVHVELEKLKLVRKELLKEAILFISITIVIILLGLYIRSTEWTQFPIFPAAIAAGAILLGIGLRPLQHYKSQFAEAEEKRETLGNVLNENNLKYTADVQVSKNIKGEYDIKKSIKFFRVKP